MSHRYLQLLFTMLLALGVDNMAKAQDMDKPKIVLVASKESPIQKLSKTQIKKIYLGRVRTLPNGEKVVAVDNSQEDIKEIFYSKVVGKKGSALKAYWAKLIFTGRGHPPQDLQNDDEIKKWLQDNKNAIGYIEVKNLDQSLKILYKVM